MCHLEDDAAGAGPPVVRNNSKNTKPLTDAARTEKDVPSNRLLSCRTATLVIASSTALLVGRILSEETSALGVNIVHISSDGASSSGDVNSTPRPLTGK